MRTKRLLAIALMIAMLLFSLQTAIGEPVADDLASDIIDTIEEETAMEDTEDEDPVEDEEVDEVDEIEEDALEVEEDDELLVVAEEDEEDPESVVEEEVEAEDTDLAAALEDGDALLEEVDDAETPDVVKYAAADMENVTAKIISASGELTVTEFQTLQLEVVTNADAKVQNWIWSSSNEDVSSVSDEGVVTAYDVEEEKEVKITAKAYQTDETTGEIVENGTVLSAETTITIVPQTSRIALFDEENKEIPDAEIISVKDTERVVSFKCMPKDVVEQDVTLASSDPSVLAFDKYDATHIALIPMGDGTATLTLTSADGVITRNVTVNVVKGDVSGAPALVVPAQLLVVKGKKAAIVPQVTPKGAYKSVKYSYKSGNKKIATVTSTGVVKGVKVGTIKTKKGITVTATITMLDDTIVTQKKYVTVNVVSSSSVKVSKLKSDKTELLVGRDTATLTATLSAGIKKSAQPVVWTTSNSKVAVVEGVTPKAGAKTVKAVVTPVGAGVVTITAKTNDGMAKKKTIKLTVYNKASRLVISGPAVVGKSGQAVTLTAEPEAANERSGGVTWSSSDASVIAVDETGKLTINAAAPDDSRVTITATDKLNPRAIATKEITVKEYVAEKVEISRDGTAISEATVLLSDGTVQLAAQITPQGADQTVAWKSSNEKVATVDESGKVTLITTGKAVITATAADGSEVEGKVTLTVVNPTESFDLVTNEVAVGKTITLEAVLPEGAAQGKATFSQTAAQLKESKAYFTFNAKKGTVKGVKAGTVKKAVTVTVNDVTRTFDIVVKSTAATKVTVKRTDDAPNAFIIPVFVEGSDSMGGTAQLTATVAATKTASQKVVWTSSDEGIATVDQNGLVTAKANVTGKTVKITATAQDGSKKAGAYTVRIGYPAEHVEPKTNSTDGVLYVVKGKSTPKNAIFANVTREDGIAPSWKTVTWKLVDKKGKANTTYATINAKTGVVKGKKATVAKTPIYAVATASDGSKVVSENKVQVVVLAKATSSAVAVKIKDAVPEDKSFLYRGETAKMSATVTNSKQKEIAVGVAWTSSNPKVVSITPEGDVEALAVGKATITATTQDGAKKTATLDIEVFEPADRIEVRGRHAVAKGGKLQLTAIVYDEQGNVIKDSPVKWSIEAGEGVATIDEKKGIVTGGENTGHAKVTAQALATDKTVTSAEKPFEIEVTEPAASLTIWLADNDVTNNANPIYLDINKKPNSVQLTARTNPDSADPNVEWKSSDESVLTVNVNGVVTPVGSGEATVKAIYKNDETVYAEAKFVVGGIAIEGPEEGWLFKQNNGTPAKITVTLDTADETNTAVAWTSTDEEVATIEADGTIVLGGKAGKTTITATSVVGGFVSNEVELTVTEFNFEIDGDGAHLTKFVGVPDENGKVTIPAYINGSLVTEVGNDGNVGAFEDNTAITSVEIPNSVTVIGAHAFKGCSNLTTMTTYDYKGQ